MIIYKQKSTNVMATFPALLVCMPLIKQLFQLLFGQHVTKVIGYRGPDCELRCPFPSYGEGCQMLCYCIGKMCDPVNGCNITSSGILHVFSIAFFLVCHLQLYINICKGLYLSLFLEYPVTSFIGLAYKIVTTELLNYEASISESKYHFV